MSAAAASATNTTSVRGESRALADFYFSTTTGFGRPNRRAVLDNPLKGLLTSPRYTGFDTPDAPIPSTLEFYYIGLSEYVDCRLWLVDKFALLGDRCCIAFICLSHHSPWSLKGS